MRITLEQHLKNNKAKIEADAVEYAKHYNCTLEKAREDMETIYGEGYHDEADEERYN
jgi:hypothetical protein